MNVKNDVYWMKIALREANKSFVRDEVPVGVVITIDNKLVSYSHNSSISSKDPTAHAEIKAIRDASKVINNYRLKNATLYSTLEPCAMCYGAIIHSRIKKVVFGAYDNKTGVCGSCASFDKLECFNHVPEIIGGVLENDCSMVLKNFFKDKRN